MLQRVLSNLMGIKNILVLNDEAHHCYREKPDGNEEEDLTGDDKDEARENREAARLWITGIETVSRTLGIQRVIDLSATPWDAEARDARDFVQVMLETLRTSGVQQAHKEDRITFSSLTPWPGDLVCAEGRYQEGSASGKEDGPERRAAILIGPEFGTLTRLQLVRAAREAGDGGFDILIACAFSYDAHSAELDHLGRVRVLKARMNADLHMATDLKNTGKGNLFVIFGEPDIEVSKLAGDQVQVRVRGVDVFQPSTGEVRSSGPDGIACWFLDTDYNEESFFVRHAYFLGSGDPYRSLKTTLKAEIDEEAWDSLNSDTSPAVSEAGGGQGGSEGDQPPGR